MDGSLKVVTYQIETDKVKEKITLAFVADLHSCDYGRGQKYLMQKIEGAKPDVLLLGGDIIDDDMPEVKAVEFLKAIEGRYPTYYVSGNHEYWTGDIGRMKEIIRRYGISILEGTKETLTLGQDQIDICGVDDPYVGEAAWAAQMTALIESPKSHYTVFLSHRPERIKTYLPGQFDLILAGHAHGGQWRIPGLINGVFAPNQGLFPKYAGGLYEFEKSKLIVSRGLARESTRVPRIFNRPELVVVELLPLAKSD